MLYSICHSGLVVPESRGNETVPEVVTTSGYALLHFFSDAAYNLTGFNIAYSYGLLFPLIISHCHLLDESGTKNKAVLEGRADTSLWVHNLEKESAPLVMSQMDNFLI